MLLEKEQSESAADAVNMLCLHEPTSLFPADYKPGCRPNLSYWIRKMLLRTADSLTQLFLRFLCSSVFQRFLVFNFGDLWQFWHFWQLPRSSASSVPLCFKGFAFRFPAIPAIFALSGVQDRGPQQARFWLVGV
jgi:hypothetical protein